MWKYLQYCQIWKKKVWNFSVDNLDYGRIFKKFESNTWIWITITIQQKYLMKSRKKLNWSATPKMSWSHFEVPNVYIDWWRIVHSYIVRWRNSRDEPVRFISTCRQRLVQARTFRQRVTGTQARRHTLCSRLMQANRQTTLRPNHAH